MTRTYEIAGWIYGPTDHGERRMVYTVHAENRERAKSVLRDMELFPSVLPTFDGTEGQASVDYRTIKEVKMRRSA